MVYKGSTIFGIELKTADCKSERHLVTMAISRAAGLFLLGTLWLANAVPVPNVNPVQSQLETLTITARFLYEELSVFEETLSQPCHCPPNPDVTLQDVNFPGFPLPNLPNFNVPYPSFPTETVPAQPTSSRSSPGEHVITGYNGNNMFNYEDGGNGLRIHGKK